MLQNFVEYHKNSKYLDTKNSYHKNGTVWFYNAVMYPKDPNEMANSVDLDQTAPIEAF